MRTEGFWFDSGFGCRSAVVSSARAARVGFWTRFRACGRRSRGASRLYGASRTAPERSHGSTAPQRPLRRFAARSGSARRPPFGRLGAAARRSRSAPRVLARPARPRPPVARAAARCAAGLGPPPVVGAAKRRAEGRARGRARAVPASPRGRHRLLGSCLRPSGPPSIRPWTAAAAERERRAPGPGESSFFAASARASWSRLTVVCERRERPPRRDRRPAGCMPERRQRSPERRARSGAPWSPRAAATSARARSSGARENGSGAASTSFQRARLPLRARHDRREPGPASCAHAGRTRRARGASPPARHAHPLRLRSVSLARTGNRAGHREARELQACAATSYFDDRASRNPSA